MLINNENLRWIFMEFESRNVNNSPHNFREKNNVLEKSTCQKRHHNISTYIKMCVYDIENIRSSCFFLNSKWMPIIKSMGKCGPRNLYLLCFIF